jgi:cation transporter-like permease
MSGFTLIGVLLVAGVAFAIIGSLVALVVVLAAGRRGRDGDWDSHPPHDAVRLRAGGGLGRGSSH